MISVYDYSGGYEVEPMRANYEIGTLVEFVPPYKDVATVEQQDIRVGTINEITFRKTKKSTELLYIVGDCYIQEERILAIFDRREVDGSKKQ